MANPVPALKTPDVPTPLFRGNSSDIPTQTNVVPYTVQEGETLFGIALKHRMNHSQIRKLNGLYGSNTLYPGQVLLVFHLNNHSSLQPEAKSPRPESSEQGEEVKEGSTTLSSEIRGESESSMDESTIYANIQLCVRGEEFCRLVPGDLVINGHYLSFMPISSLSPKHRDGMNAFEFRLDLYEIEFATVVQMSSQTEEDYVKVVWKNEANELSSLFFIAASTKAQTIVNNLTSRIEAVRSRDRTAESYTSGKCLRSGLDFDIHSMLTEPTIAVDRHASSFKIDIRRTKSAKEFSNDEEMSSESASMRRKRNSFAGSRPRTSVGRSPRLRSRVLSGASQGLRKSFSFIKGYLRSSSSFSEQDEVTEDFLDHRDDLPEVIAEEPEIREPPEWFSPKCESAILSGKQAMELRYTLPTFMRAYLWLKLYDFVNHGVSLEKLYQNVRLYQATLMVIKTTHGDIIGAYCSEPWEKSKSHQFYGTGECFVYKFRRMEDELLSETVEDAGEDELLSETVEDEGEDELCVYRWTESNSFFMNSSISHLGIGGGGNGFAISLDGDLNHGTTNASATFGNPMLLSCGDDGSFQILNLEIYGFEGSRMAKRRMSSMLSDTELFSQP